MGGITVRKPLKERVVSAVKWALGVIATLSVSVMSCTTGLDAARGMAEEGFNVPGVGQLGILQDKPDTPGDMCAAALRFEVQTDKAIGSLNSAVTGLKPLTECADTKRDLASLVTQAGIDAAVREDRDRRMIERLNTVEELLRRIVEAEGADVVGALKEAEAYVEDMKTRDTPATDGPVDAAPTS